MQAERFPSTRSLVILEKQLWEVEHTLEQVAGELGATLL